MLHLLLQQQVASVLSLSSSPSAPAPVVEYIASIPAVYAAPVLVAKYIALHQQCTLHLHLRWSQRAGTSSVHCTCTSRGVHRVSTISVLRRASTGTVYFVPAPVSYASLIATAIGCFGSLPVEPTVYTGICGGLHRDGTSVYVALALDVDYIAPAPSGYATPALLVVYIAPASAVNVAPSPVVEHIAPAQVVSYAEEIFESSSHVRRRLLASYVESNALLSLSWSIPFILVIRCR